MFLGWYSNCHRFFNLWNCQWLGRCGRVCLARAQPGVVWFHFVDLERRNESMGCPVLQFSEWMHRYYCCWDCFLCRDKLWCKRSHAVLFSGNLHMDCTYWNAPRYLYLKSGGKCVWYIDFTKAHHKNISAITSTNAHRCRRHKAMERRCCGHIPIYDRSLADWCDSCLA